MDSNQYPFLSSKFLERMNAIGRYGHDKYAEQSFHHRRSLGDNSRGPLLHRTGSEAIATHAGDHFKMYLRGELHDKFGTLGDQLAASAFNCMMEFFFAGLEDEQ